MGAACCVASSSRDKTIQSGSRSTNDISHRNIRNSPTWSFRWDHRGRVAGEDTSINWFSDGISRNDGSENKNESALVSADGSPSHNCQRNRCGKSLISEGTAAHVRGSTSDQSISRTVSMDLSVEQANALGESSIVSYSSPTKPPLPLTYPSPTKPPLHSSSLSASPLSSQYHMPSSSLTPSRWPLRSPGHKLFRQTSDNRIPAYKSPSNFSLSEERPEFPSRSNSGMRSRWGSSDGWSIPGFSELMGTPQRERWSFDSESCGSSRERLARSNSWFSVSPVDSQTCGVCSKLLTEKSSWGAQKIIANNDLSVVAVLICGHAYHAECLETMTPDISKYDPACPVCCFGEKQTMKLSKKALKAETDLKARSKKSKNRVVDSDIDEDSEVSDHFKGEGLKVQGPKMDSSSSGRSSSGKHFLRRHFSFVSKGSRSMLDNHPTRKKGFFWAKSSKE